MRLEDKIIQHKVILDLNPDVRTFSSVPQWVELDLHRNGEWYCSYMGFVDAKQLDELRSIYDLKENTLDSFFGTLNRELQRIGDDPTMLEALLEKVTRAQAAGSVPEEATPPQNEVVDDPA
jgi:hypothetical protein